METNKNTDETTSGRSDRQDIPTVKYWRSADKQVRLIDKADRAVRLAEQADSLTVLQPNYSRVTLDCRWTVQRAMCVSLSVFMNSLINTDRVHTWRSEA